jgi:hypothetical protein
MKMVTSGLIRGAGDGAMAARGGDSPENGEKPPGLARPLRHRAPAPSSTFLGTRKFTLTLRDWRATFPLRFALRGCPKELWRLPQGSNDRPDEKAMISATLPSTLLHSLMDPARLPGPDRLLCVIACGHMTESRPERRRPAGLQQRRALKRGDTDGSEVSVQSCVPNDTAAAGLGWRTAGSEVSYAR